MNKAIEEEVEPPLAVLVRRKRGKNKSAKRESQSTTSNTAPVQDEPEPLQLEPEPVSIEPEPVPIDAEPVQIEPESVQIDEENSRNGPRVSVSMFDDSVENHFRVMHTISELCGEAEDEPFSESDIQRWSSSTTFLREWADFKYEPRDVRFACEAESPDGKDVTSGINLRQFSSATVPKNEALPGDTSPPELSQDFVMYVGGPVWALDWCPRVHESQSYHTKCEFIAVAAHPPGSSYHKLGEPLTGRGAIQIWCLLNVSVNDGGVPLGEKSKREHKKSGAIEKSTEPKRPLGRPRKKPIEESVGEEATEEKLTKPKRPLGRPRKKPIEEKSTQPKRPRGRPRKKPFEESVDNLDGSNNCDEVLAIDYPKESSESHSMDCVPANTQGNDVQEDHDKAQPSYRQTQPKRPRGRPRKKTIKEPVEKVDGSSNNNVEVLAIEYTKDLLESHYTDCVIVNTQGDTVQEDHDKKQSSYKLNRSKRPRGIQGKKPIEESVDNLDGSSNTGEALAAQYPMEALELDGMDCALESTQGDAVQDDCGKKRKRYRKIQPKIPRRKPGEKPTGESVDNLDGSINYVEALAVQHLKETSELHAIDCVPANTQGHDVQEAHNETLKSSGQGPQTSNNLPNNGYTDIVSARCSVPKDVALPRIIFCIAHHGKVAWDVKWRPFNEHDSKCKHRMGYLAVLLGNGSLEVWEVPVSRAIEVIYSSSSGEGTDPRFVKLAPVFRCSMLKCGDKKSIPLTVEWSASPPHDYLLAGCHDGTVAMWKFSASNSSQDTRPLLCFSADTNPIRALSWAPVESNSDSANVIATAGHGGLKFWDLRDPFRPLWDIDHIPRFIYSLDWLPDPRCVLISFDDGTMRLLSLTKAASDTPVTGKPFAGTKQQGLHNLGCLPFAIWSVQVSRLTGMVAYCGADGTVLRFQLTSKAVEKDAIRNRAPHFLCVSLTEEDSVVTVHTPIPNNPFPLKTSRKAEPNKVKRENDKIATTSEDQVLALCYGDDRGIELESGKDVASLKSKTQKSGSSERKPEDDRALVCMDQEPFNTGEDEIGEKGPSLKSIVKQKSKSSKKTTEDEQELVCRNEELMNTPKEKIGTEYEVFPSKLVAMHRVRWNMNKGSERWLCYGGAAGIVRCQEIVLSETDMKWARKK